MRSKSVNPRQCRMLPSQRQKEDETNYQELCKLEQERSMRLVKQNWVLQSEL